MKNKNYFNKNIKNIKQASSIYWNQIASEKKKINKNFTILSLGEAFLKPKKISLDKFLTEKNFHYSDSRGTPELRKKIADLYLKKHRIKINYKKEIIVSSGSKILTFMSMLALLNRSDKVYTFEPAWLSYADQAKIIGNKIKFLNYNINFQDLEKKLKKDCKIFILNNPNNPSGKLYSKKYLNQFLSILSKKKIILVCDEAYSEFNSYKESFHSALEFHKYKKNVIVINSFSKNFSMSGWRIGYLIADAKVIEKILILNQHLITCAPTILQNYISHNFNKLYTHNKKQIQKLLKKRNKIIFYLKKYNIKFLEGNSTFYFFIKIPNFINVKKLSIYLLNNQNISVVPGESYGKNTKNFIRISIGTETEAKIVSFIQILKKIFDKKITF